jgi:Xaa-Pro aminopeptidase
MQIPEIPKAEYAQRVEKVRRLMRSHRVDAVYVYHDELRHSNGIFLTNYWPIIEGGGVLVAPEGEPILVGGPEAEAYAREVSVVKTLRAVDALIVPEEEYPGATIVPLAEVFREALRGKPLRRLGIVGLDILPYGLATAVQRAFPGVELVDMSRDYEVMRAVKSEAEIAMMRHSFDIGAEGIKAAIPFIKPGASEFEVVGAAEGRMRSLGIDGFNFRGLVASGPRTNGVVPPASDKKLKAGELVMVGFSPKHRGYASGTCCTFAVNHPPTPEQRQFLIDLADTLEYTRDALRPGLRGREIDAVPRGFLSKKGYGPYLTMGFVHTVGLNEFERPFFGPNSDEVLEPNLTVCVDVSMFNHPVFYGSRVEAGYVIREKGCEVLSQSLEDLILSLRQPDGLWSQGRG